MRPSVPENSSLKVARIPLADRVAALLSARIAAGEFATGLPAQRALAETLGVSRRVVGEALEVMKVGKVFVPGTGRRRIPRTMVSPVAVRPKIALVTGDTGHDAVIARLIAGLRAVCEEAGREFLVIAPPEPATSVSPEVRAKRLVERYGCELWIGVVLPETQTFDALHAAGQRVLGLHFLQNKPYAVIADDYDATYAHAFTAMLRRGRTRVVMPMAVTRKPEQVEAIGALYTARGLHFNADRVMPVFDGTKKGLLATLDQYAGRGDGTPPDGIIMPYGAAADIVTVQGWLMRRRLLCPEDVSLLGIHNEIPRDRMTPLPGVYAASADRFLATTLRVARDFFRHGKLPAQRKLLPMRYLRGESL